MRLVESEGKCLLAGMGIAIPPAAVDGPCFVKAQVLRGGRGKAGLVRRADTAAEAERAKREISEALGGTPEAGFLVERAVPHVREWFFSIDLDRAAGDWRVNLGEGGMDVAAARSVPFAAFDHPVFAPLARRIMRGMRAHRLELVEINPLAEALDGSLFALDAKVVREDGASASRIALDGDIALVLAGGGASLVALDALAAAGGRPANFVELSGNPDPSAAQAAIAEAFSRPGLRAVWVAGSYANFTDIAAMLGAVRRAYDAAGLAVPVVVRRDGPNADLAERETLAWAQTKGIACRFHRADVDLHASAGVLMSLL